MAHLEVVPVIVWAAPFETAKQTLIGIRFFSVVPPNALLYGKTSAAFRAFERLIWLFIWVGG
jgi:hypothetical protein